MDNLIGKLIANNEHEEYIVIAQRQNDAVVMKLCRPEYVVITDLQGFKDKGQWANGRYHYVAEGEESRKILQMALNELK